MPLIEKVVLILAQPEPDLIDLGQVI